MSTATTRDLVVKAAAIKAVKDAVGQAEAEVKAALEGHMDPGDRKTALVDGRPAATITFTKTQAGAAVTNPSAFQAWVEANHPEQMDRVPITVDPDDLAWLVGVREVNEHQDRMDYCVAFDRLLDAVTGSRRQVRGSFTASVLAAAKVDKMAVDRETGEAIPGVTYSHGGEPGYITVRQDEAQKDAITEAWQAGSIDLTHLALTPLAELEASA